MQIVEIGLDSGEGVRAEVGAMLFMEEGIEMQTTTGGGLFKGFKRMLAGESFFITTFLNNAKDQKKVAFSAPFPGKILAVDLSRIRREHFMPEGRIPMRCQGHRDRCGLHKKTRRGPLWRRRFYSAEATGGRSCIHSCRWHASGKRIEAWTKSSRLIPAASPLLLQALTMIFSS